MKYNVTLKCKKDVTKLKETGAERKFRGGKTASARSASLGRCIPQYTRTLKAESSFRGPFLQSPKTLRCEELPLYNKWQFGRDLSETAFFTAAFFAPFFLSLSPISRRQNRNFWRRDERSAWLR